jgi:hypothetical protein
MSEQQDPPDAVHSAERPVERIIEEWFRRTIHDSPVARSTEAFNHLRQALGDLKRRIIEEL